MTHDTAISFLSNINSIIEGLQTELSIAKQKLETHRKNSEREKEIEEFEILKDKAMKEIEEMKQSAEKENQERLLLWEEEFREKKENDLEKLQEQLSKISNVHEKQLDQYNSSI